MFGAYSYRFAAGINDQNYRNQRRRMYADKSILFLIFLIKAIAMFSIKPEIRANQGISKDSLELEMIYY